MITESSEGKSFQPEGNFPIIGHLNKTIIKLAKWNGKFLKWTDCPIDLRLRVILTESLNFQAEITFWYFSWFSPELWSVFYSAHFLNPNFLLLTLWCMTRNKCNSKHSDTLIILWLILYSTYFCLNLLEPFGIHQSCYGTPLPLPVHIFVIIHAIRLASYESK
jgi:hypothetical protein